jgi:hypothetical protein
MNAYIVLCSYKLFKPKTLLLAMMPFVTVLPYDTYKETHIQ